MLLRLTRPGSPLSASGMLILLIDTASMLAMTASRGRADKQQQNDIPRFFINLRRRRKHSYCIAANIKPRQEGTRKTAKASVKQYIVEPWFLSMQQWKASGRLMFRFSIQYLWSQHEPEHCPLESYFADEFAYVEIEQLSISFLLKHTRHPYHWMRQHQISPFRQQSSPSFNQQAAAWLANIRQNRSKQRILMLSAV